MFRRIHHYAEHSAGSRGKKNLIEADWMQDRRHQADRHSNKIVNFKQRVRDENSSLFRSAMLWLRESDRYGLERLSCVHPA